jgi:hypothetical protein
VDEIRARLLESRQRRDSNRGRSGRLSPVEVDAEAKRLRQQFGVLPPREPTDKRLQRTLGVEKFDTSGNFSPDRIERNSENALSLERLRNKMTSSASLSPSWRLM